jgi:hypothetical protein
LLDCQVVHLTSRDSQRLIIDDWHSRRTIVLFLALVESVLIVQACRLRVLFGGLVCTDSKPLHCLSAIVDIVAVCNT